MDETGEAKLFSANITADDHYEMLARGEYILEQFGPDADNPALRQAFDQVGAEFLGQPFGTGHPVLVGINVQMEQPF